MFVSTNSFYEGSIPDINYKEFCNFFSLFTFSLTSDQKQHKDSLPICASGIARLKITYKEAVPINSSPQILHVIAMYPSLLQMDENYMFSASYRTS